MQEDNVPEWFRDFINQDYEDRWLEVAGCKIHYQQWLPSVAGKRGLLFVPGSGAHAHWWDFIAPAFLDRYNVAAIDLSGMGDSGHRDQYDAAQFVTEIMDVARDAGLVSAPESPSKGRTAAKGRTPASPLAQPSLPAKNLPTKFLRSDIILIGHSFGGSMSRLAASLHGDDLGGIVMVDSNITWPDRRRRFHASNLRKKPRRLYKDLQTATRRFKLRPPQPCDNQFIIDHIARHSVCEVEGGWCWKLDQRMFAKMVHGQQHPTRIANINCPTGLIYGSDSRFFPDSIVKETSKLLPSDALIEISQAHHHVFLDQPLAFIDALHHLIDRW